MGVNDYFRNKYSFLNMTEFFSNIAYLQELIIRGTMLNPAGEHKIR